MLSKLQLKNSWLGKKISTIKFSLSTKSREELIQTFYPYAIMLALAIILTVGSVIIFHCLPDYKNTVHSTTVTEQKTVYSDDTMSFVGLNDLKNFDDLEKAKMPKSADSQYVSEIVDIISELYSDATPVDSSSLVGKFTYYTFGGAEVPSDDTDFSNHDFHSGYESYDYNEEGSSETVNFTGYSSGILLVADKVSYKSESGTKYELSAISCGDNYYYFNLKKSESEEIDSDEFYRVISELDINSWNTEAASLMEVFQNLTSQYNEGAIYSGSKFDFVNSIDNTIEDSEVRRLFERLTDLALDYNDEGGYLEDYYSFAGTKLPLFIEKACSALQSSSRKTLDGSSIIITSESELFNGYKLGFIYDLHSGEISGFGLCK